MLASVLTVRDALRRHRHCPAAPVLSDVLQSLTALLEGASEDRDYESLLAQVRAHVANLASVNHCEDLQLVEEAITCTCGATVRAVQQRQKTRRDIAAVVASARQTVDSLVARHASATSEWTDAIARLRRLQHATSLAEVQLTLAAETEALSRIVADVERRHAADVHELSECVSAAEEQLALSGGHALSDPLTGVTNRHGFDLALAEQLEVSDPTTPVVLALFDVDALSTVNDQFGHGAGDAVLKHVASTVRHAVRPHDVVARIGGDEFALIASGLPLARAEARLRQIVHAIGNGSIAPGGAVVSVRCGASEVGAGDTAAALFHRADQALIEAKGRVHQHVVTRAAPSIRTLLQQSPPEPAS